MFQNFLLIQIFQKFTKQKIKTEKERSKSAGTANEHGICHRRGLTMPPVTPIPDLRSDLDHPPPHSASASTSNRPPFQGH